MIPLLFQSSLRYSPQQFSSSPQMSPAPLVAAHGSRDAGATSPCVLDSRELQHEANNQLHSIKLQQMMLQSRAKQWVEQQQQQVHTGLYLTCFTTNSLYYFKLSIYKVSSPQKLFFLNILKKYKGF